MRPKNPFQCEHLYGIDIRAEAAALSGATVATANLSFDPIPFEDHFFDSVSAYDFLEHVPRVALDHATRTSRFPFIELMNEIWRVLRHDGILYAVTPAFPNEKSLRDPTHVNFITRKTCRYFTQPQLLARMYGFQGNFTLVRQCWIRPRGAYEPMRMGVVDRLKRIGERLGGQQSHLVWEFKAVKRDPA